MPLQTIPPRGYRVESRCRLGGGLAAQRQGIERTSKIMTSYRYLEDSGVHILDCSGMVDLQTGLARLRALDLELKRRPMKGNHWLLLVDFRNTVWESEDVHLQLARTTRCDFGLNADNTAIRAAILNSGWQGPVSENEHWFLTESEALQWLRSG